MLLNRFLSERYYMVLMVLDGDKCTSGVKVQQTVNATLSVRDEDPRFFWTDPDPAQLEKKSGSYSGSDLKSK